MLTIKDLCYSETAVSNSLRNYPAHDYIQQNLEKLCLLLNKCFIPAERIISGYRTPKLNKLIHGAPDSSHMYGKAIDLACHNEKHCLDTIFELYEACLSLGFNIDYFYMSRSHKKIHVDFDFD